MIGPEVALRLARNETSVADTHQLVAPTLMRSQVLSLLYEAVQRGETTQGDAERQLDYLRGLRMRLLGDRVLQRTAWKVAEQLSWTDTFTAEYIAATQLQADAFVTLDAELVRAVKGLIRVAPIKDLI